jgi:hypothetical protein
VSGDDFRSDPASLREAATSLRGHADEVDGHGRALSVRTEGRVGHGPIGELIETLLRRGLHAVGEGATKAVSDFHRATAEGLAGMATRAEQTDARVALGLPHEHEASLAARGGGQRSLVRERMEGRSSLDEAQPGPQESGAPPAAEEVQPKDDGQVKPYTVTSSGGLNFLAPSDLAGIRASKNGGIGGYTDVISHANEHVFGLSDGTLMSPSEIASAIRHAPDYKGGPVRLLACKAGVLDDGAAQGVADEMGVQVMAATDTVWPAADGTLVVGPNPWTPSGTWRVFDPGNGGE